jgi:hypothetical protein
MLIDTPLFLLLNFADLEPKALTILDLVGSKACQAF